MATDDRPNRLKGIREKGVVLTQKEVGRILDLDHTSISRHENGRGLSQDVIQRYTELYKLDGSHEIFFDPEEFVAEEENGSED